MDNLKQIQENIIKEFGLENAPEEKKVTMIESIGKMIFQAVLMRSMDTLEEEEQVELEKIVDENGEPEKIFQYLEEKIDGFQDIIKEEAEKIKTEFVESMNLIK
jgi:hypothetical protein